MANIRRPVAQEFDDDVEVDDGDDQGDGDDHEGVPPPVGVTVDDEEKKESRTRKVWRGGKEWFLKPFVQGIAGGLGLFVVRFAMQAIWPHKYPINGWNATTAVTPATTSTSAAAPST